MPSRTIFQAIQMAHLLDKYLPSVFLCLLVSAVFETSITCHRSTVFDVSYHLLVFTLLLARHSCQRLSAILTLACQAAATIGAMPAAVTVACLLLAVICVLINTTKLIKTVIRTPSQKSVMLRQPSLKLKAQRKKSRLQVDEAPCLGATKFAAPLANTLPFTVRVSRLFVGSNRKRRLMGCKIGALLASSILVQPVGATSKASQQKSIECIVTSSVLAANCPEESEPGLTEGDLIMIALTVFFGIFIVTAAIWGPLYFIRKARRQRRVDPEVLAADGAVSEHGHSDRAAVGDTETGSLAETPPWMMSLCRRVGHMLKCLRRVIHIRAPRKENNLWPLDTLQAGRRFDDEVPQPDEHEQDGEDPLDPLADIHPDLPNPGANRQVDPDAINNFIALRSQSESHLAPIGCYEPRQVDMNLVQVQDNDEEEPEDAGETQSEPSPSVHDAISVAPVTKCNSA